MRKAYSYIRMSTEIQLKGDSLRRQLQLSKDYAKKHNLELVESIQDIGVSAFKGRNAKQGAFSRILAAIEAGEITAGDYLLVESLDRISRQSVITAFNQFSNILSKGILIVTLTDNQEYSKDSIEKNIGQLFTSLGVMLRAYEESQIKSERLKAVWKQKRDNITSEKLTKRACPWLSLSDDRKSFSIIEEKANIIKDIYSMALNGMGNYSITKSLNKRKVPSLGNGKAFHQSYIQKVLTNRSVTGEYQPQIIIEGKRVNTGKPILNYYPEIISKELFDKVQVCRQQRKVMGAGRRGKAFNNLFSGLLTCKSCGGNVLYHNKGKKPKGSPILQCTNSVRGNGCQSFLWNYHAFEESFFQFVHEINISTITSDNNINELETLKQDRNLLVTTNKTLDKKISELLDMFGSDESEDMKSRIAVTIRNSNSQIEDNKIKINELNIRISDLEQSNIVRDIGEIKKVIAQVNQEADIDKKYILRCRIASLIKQTVENITIDCDNHIKPFDDFDEMINGDCKLVCVSAYIPQGDK